jgi:hypothetical protein
LVAGPEETKNFRLIQDPFSDAEFGKIMVGLSRQFAASASRRFQFQKRSQDFIRTHNETLSIVAMCVQQSRLFALQNPRLKPSPNSIRLY